MIWVYAGVALIVIFALTIALCQAAGRADRRLEQAREDLKGPEDRRRVGL